jgi:hypothetical protein
VDLRWGAQPAPDQSYCWFWWHCLSAMVVAGLAVWDGVNGPDGASVRTMEERLVENWDALTAAGQRMGP